MLMVWTVKSDFQKYSIITKKSQQVLYLKSAQGSWQTARGLMFINYLPHNHGMLFIFEKASKQAFWMENTYITLDMIFLDHDGVVKTLVKAAQPFSQELIFSDSPTRYVIELPSGAIDTFEIQLGDKIILP
jgi:hypothetical protein